MITLDEELQAHLDGRVTSLAVCWKLVRRDGQVIRGTESDSDVVITTGLYAGTYRARTGLSGTSSSVKSSSDLSVDNLEVVGPLRSSGDLSIFSISASDIEAGLLDNADIVVFLTNWQNPDGGQRVLRKGTIGNVTRTSEGQYRTEMRGLSQALSQTIVRTYGAKCDAELGDARCTVDMTPFTFSRTVTVAPSRRQFQIDSNISGLVINPGGKATFTSGANDGYSMEIKSYSSLQVELFMPMPNEIQIGDTVTITFGCDKRRETCINTYNNIVNFRGHGVFVPGQTEVFKIGGQ